MKTDSEFVGPMAQRFRHYGKTFTKLRQPVIHHLSCSQLSLFHNSLRHGNCYIKRQLICSAHLLSTTYVHLLSTTYVRTAAHLQGQTSLGHMLGACFGDFSE